ncbi:AAA family ATPase [Crenothrix sp.]|uniref:AAA family ATPase n=1 Tax=Crenothrix sp. TaxID=3100433 RepID=UPI00374DBA1D
MSGEVPLFSYKPTTPGVIMDARFMGKRRMAEQSVLGGLMLDNSKWPEIQSIVTEDDFFDNRHKIIFKAIKRQLQANQPVDVIIISDVEGLELSYIGMLAKDTPSAANIVNYAKIMKTEAERQQIAETLTHALANIHKGDEPEQVLKIVIEQAEKAIINTQKGGFMFTSINKISVKPIEWLVDDFIETNSLVEAFGAPESGKSLLAIDWGLSVSAGIPWRGHNTQKGAVFYIAGEGHNGLSRRFSAWGLSNGVDLDSLDFYPSLQAAAFYNKQSAISVERAISTIASKNGIAPKLIIIDTLARNFGGGNENSTEDMNLFIVHIDALRAKFNCTVLLVHHTGHGAGERARGSSVLKAAVDTEFSLSKNNGNIINLNCTKMKDAAHPAPKSFTISSIDLGIEDDKGHAANGPVLSETMYTAPEPKDKPLADNQVMALDALERLTEEHRQNFIDLGKNPDESKVTEKLWREQLGEMKAYEYRNIKNGLLKRDLISIDDGFVYLI